jgi:SAM-dependent methyltransferase
VIADVIWHDLECGGYEEDLPLWRSLAREALGPVLDVGAGTGRVSIDLAAHGVEVVALDRDAALLEALKRRADGLPVETVAGDARELALGRRFALILLPMQTLQLLGGPRGRAEFLSRALEHLQPGGRVAAALGDALDCFDEEHDLPPPPDACEVGGVRYSSRLLAVTEENGRAAIHRRREVAAPGEAPRSEPSVVHLDRVSADEVAAEAEALGFEPEPHLSVPETEEYIGSTVVVLRRGGSDGPDGAHGKAR